MTNLPNIIKIILALLFFLCLADMPYGFYQIVRFVELQQKTGHYIKRLI